MFLVTTARHIDSQWQFFGRRAHESQALAWPRVNCPDPEQAPGPGSTSTFGDTFASFVNAVRSRKREDLTAEVEEGAISTTLVHLANISYRVGRTVHFDPKTYTCIGDSEANALFTRPQYRAPFVVPKLA